MPPIFRRRPLGAVRKSAPPRAGSAGRLAIPDPSLQHLVRASVIETKEVHMEDIRDIYAEIAELRAELAHCILTRRERRETQLRLVQALTEADHRQREAEVA